MALSMAVLAPTSFSSGLGLAPSMARAQVSMNMNEMEPEEGWNVENLTGMMDEAVVASFDIKTMPGVSGPLGFFDPLDFCGDASEGKVRFYREVELKHGRVAMLAAVGILVSEPFHPLWGGNVDVPAYIAFQETPLQSFWPAVVLAIAVPEVFSVFSFNSPFGGEPWTIRSDYEPGNLGFDPLGLRPEKEADFKEMQTKELNNGRLAMIATAGMIGQELATGSKLF